MKNHSLKSTLVLFMSALLVCSGCSAGNPAPAQESQDEKGDLSIQTPEESQNKDGDSEKQENSNTVIVSCSWPVTGMGDSDTDTSASVVVEDGKVEGNTEYAASIIAGQTGDQWIRLQTQEAYPVDYDTLVDQAKEEQNENARPALAEVPDLSGVDRVILVTPNWWSDLPMPVYTFLESEDWSGKEIVPVVVHGGSGLSQIVETLSEYADVDADKALSISRSSLMSSEDTIKEWAESL